MANVDEILKAFCSSISEMLADKRFHFPLAAAQTQYRANYPGMTSAALLEVIFEDALENFFNSRRPNLTFSRAPKSEKNWDYEFEGIRFGHKVGKDGHTNIAVLWDATVEVSTWTVPNPIMFHSGGYGSRSGLSAHLEELNFKTKDLGMDEEMLLPADSQILLVEWGQGSKVTVLERWSVESEIKVSDFFDPLRIQESLIPHIQNGTPANHFEILQVSKTFGKNRKELLASEASLLSPGTVFHIETGVRPGLYLIPQQWMVEVPVTRNNRAVLVSTAQVKSWLEKGSQTGFFIPLPVWWGIVAQHFVPDLFSPQQQDFDELFRRRN